MKLTTRVLSALGFCNAKSVKYYLSKQDISH